MLLRSSRFQNLNAFPFMKISEFIYTVLLKPAPLRKSANFLLKTIAPRTLKRYGATIHLNPNDPILPGALTLNVYERDEISFFLKSFQPNMTFVDVGANVGLYTGLAMSRNNFQGRVLCIEPDPISRQFLEKTITSNKGSTEDCKITISPFAASNTNETLVLYKNPENKCDNRIYPDEILTEQVSIQAKTLDSICESEDISEIQFLKIDVQGAEGKVLQGASKILSSSPNCILMTEFWPYGLLHCGIKPTEYIAQLQELRFNLYELSRGKLFPLSNVDTIVQKNIGRLYINLVGLKGIYQENHLHKKTS